MKNLLLLLLPTLLVIGCNTDKDDPYQECGCDATIEVFEQDAEGYWITVSYEVQTDVVCNDFTSIKGYEDAENTTISFVSDCVD